MEFSHASVLGAGTWYYLVATATQIIIAFENPTGAAINPSLNMGWGGNFIQLEAIAVPAVGAGVQSHVAIAASAVGDFLVVQSPSASLRHSVRLRY